MKSEKIDLTFEQAMSRLEEIINLLEEGGSPLDETMKLYSEGAKLASVCSSKLKKAEQIIEKVQGTKSKLKEESTDDC